MVDLVRLKKETLILESLLISHSADEQEATECLKLLEPIFTKIKKANSTIEAFSNIPCAYAFHEGKLRQHPELEEAYSQFVTTATNYDRKKLHDFFKKIKKT